ncbi:uncharacterized protein PB18E9.04c isoform X2 [Drosophila innubila]|uniref:uncharacterized protein PB18E9.04c isoform X2 n=1 Tax=Drosophila innubila TaxID=198719 RepID=UPI00148CFFEE|nr:uncharacterized protein PB18E9.04c isoform X2 [Drosophila innubila]
MVETTKFGNLEAYTYLLVTLSITLTLIVMFFNCLCCKKRIPKNDLLGLEGMVKLKNPDEIIVVSSNNANNGMNNVATSNSLVHNSESQAELNASTVSNADSEKRSSTAAHRSLPDIPVAEHNDNGSELYETVADKQLASAHNQSPQPSLKKQTSVSQHSSISQADDVSSPYSRVKGLPHDYAKVRATEHPYAQLNAPSTSNAAVAAASSTATASSKAASSQHGTDSLPRGSQLSSGSTQHLNDELTPQVEIPAASAIAGMISASQDLPYMTPPIANQHFSGDSQDSSKGYTSISVREPLANILAQQPPSKLTARNATLTRDVNDSHYATVSDDSDETYAAIEDPNNRHIPNATDIYTSGSETYAQIQPMQANPIVVAVEINNSSSLSAGNASQASSGQLPPLNQSTGSASSHRVSSSSMEHAGPVPPHVDSLRAHMHSRQASSSSSVCNLGSPKPEKRQANSPLPPTPKASLTQSQGQHHLHSAASSSNLTSGRSSVISVIEATIEGSNDSTEASDASPQRKHSKSLSPSKDVEGNRNIEGMYAKVMKKHKFSSHPPDTLGVSPLDSAAAALLMDTQKLATPGDKSRVRSNSYTAKDHGYETIPADGQNQLPNQLSNENRKSDCYAANMLQKERQQEAASSQTQQNNSSVQLPTNTPSKSTKHYETINCPPCPPLSNNDPGYEQLQATPHINDDDAKKSDYDPNYEVLKSRAHSDDGYAKVLEKKRPTVDAVDSSGGYSTIPGADANHNYASILETKAHLTAAPNETDHYARIAENAASTPGSSQPITPNSTSMVNSLSMTTSNSNSNVSTTPVSSQYESLTGTGSETDPNYESVCYLNVTTTTNTSSNNSSSNSNNSSSNDNSDHAYERLESDNNTQTSSPLSPEMQSTTPSEQLLVDDYFQV